MKIKAKVICELVLGILFIIMSILGYYKDISHMWEYCFLSGIMSGIIFISAFIYHLITKKHIAEWIFLACTADISLILIATMLIKLNLEGAFWFIHIINPILLLLFWFIFCDSRTIKKVWFAASTLLFPLIYIFVSFVRLKVVGLCAFPANMILKWTPQIIALPIILALTVIVLIYGLGLYYLNKFIHRK